MFEIYAAAASEIASFLERMRNPSLVPVGQPPAERPFLQVDYEEIEGREIDRVLGYASISSTNAPLGVPRNFEIIVDGSDSVIFPIAGLRASLQHYLNENASSAPHGSSKDFAAAVDEIAAYCEVNDLLLVFRW
jgi:hypothetical protein